MQKATIGHSRRDPGADPRSAEAELFDGLRLVFQQLRHGGPGNHSDRAAVALLAQLKALGPVRASELAERACLTASTVSRHVKELEDAGYVVRRADPVDKRATVLEVSAAGRKLVATTIAQRVQALQRAVASWPDSDVAILTELMHRLAADLEPDDRR